MELSESSSFHFVFHFKDLFGLLLPIETSRTCSFLISLIVFM